MAAKKSANQTGCGCLLVILVGLLLIGTWANRETNQPTKRDRTTEQPATSPEPDEVMADQPESSVDAPQSPRPSLIIESWRFTTEHGFVIAEGEVTNNTSAPLKNVMAVVTFYTVDGTFVKSDEALISYNPILSGQTSPFKAGGSGNPAIAKASLAFKALLGGTISSMSREDFKE